jgi:hypothetical protein
MVDNNLSYDQDGCPMRPTLAELCNRRSFLRATVIAVASGPALLESCSPSSPVNSPTSTPLHTPPEVPHPLGLLADGTDQSETLQRAIDTAADGATVILPSGRFRVDRRITIRNRHGLTVTGPSAESPFIGYTDRTGLEVGDLNSNPSRRTSQRSHWLISSGSGITLRNVTVIGPNSARNQGYALFRLELAFEPAFSVRDGAGNVTLANCHYENVYGDGIYIGGTGPPNRLVTLTDVTGAYSGRQGFAIVNVDGLRADRVICDFAGGVGLDVEPNEGSSVRNLALFGLAMGAAHFPYSFGGPGDATARQNVTLENCSAIRSRSKSSAIYARSPGTGLSIRNHLDDRQSSQLGVQLTGWSEVTIQNSKIACPHGPASTAVQLDNCSGNLSIVDNDFRDFARLVGGVASSTNVHHSGNRWDAGQAND